MDRIAEFIARHCRVLSLLALVSAAIPACYLPHVTIDNSIEVWLDRDSPEYVHYREFLQRYGSDEFIIIGSEVSEPFSVEFLDTQRRVSEGLGDIDGVAKVLSLADSYDAFRGVPPEFMGEALGESLVRGLLLGADGDTGGILVWLTAQEGPEARRHTVTAIEAAADELRQAGFEPHLVGTPLMNVELDRASTRASVTFFPVAVLVSVLILVLALRSVGGVLAPMCAVGVTVLWTVGILTWSGRSLNMVTMVLPSLLFVLALSNGIHIASRFAAHAAATTSRRGALRATLHELIRPVVLTSLTTAVGFGSLSISDMQPVADLGRFAAIGMSISLVSNLFVTPGILSWCYRGTASRPPTTTFFGLSRLGAAVAFRKRTVPTLSLLVVLVCAMCTLGITVESNVLKFFPSESPVARDYGFIASKLTGLYTLEVEIQTDLQREDAARAALASLGEAVAKRPEVARVDHYAAFQRLEGIPPTAGGMPGLAKAAEFADELSAHYRYARDGKVGLRLSALVTAMASSEFYTLLHFVRERAEELMPPSTTWHVTGIVTLLNDVQRSLVQTQLRSFGIAAAVILLTIGILFRSLRAAIAAALPNLLPVFGTLAMMAFTGVPLDAATVMIASIAIGIAADDTIHFLARYREEKTAKCTAAEATSRTLSKIGRPIAFTSIVIAGGFSVLGLAEFRPIRDFGLLTGFTMLTAFACDLFILPACAHLCRLWDTE